MVQKVVTRHAGRIWAEAKVGEGAACYFTLKKKKEW
jgi:signal transduction histidine kinase